MIKPIKNSLSFALKLLLALVLSYILHEGTHYYLGNLLGSFLIIEAYLVNYALVVLVYMVLLIIKQKNNQSVGFIFLGGFFIKLIVFMKFFNPIYKADGVVIASEFLAFFIPYAICLTFETVSLVRLLNRS